MIDERLSDPGFTPGRRDVPALLELVARAPPAERRSFGKRVVQALGRGDRPVADALLRDLFDTDADERALRIRALSRIAARIEVEELAPVLATALDDRAERVVREAIRAVAKLGGGSSRFEKALVAKLERAALPEKRAAADALGKIGGTVAETALRGLETDDADLARRRANAIALIERRGLRRTDSSIRATIAPPLALRILLRCRAGMEKFAAEQVGAFFGTTAGDIEIESRGVGLTTSRSLDELRRVRVAADVALNFDLPRGGELAQRIARGLAEPPVVSALGAWTDGPIRFRLSFVDGAPRRATVKAVAAALAASRSELHNDSRDAPWTVDVDIERARLLCVPRATEATRARVPAASHRTLAALMAWVGRPRPGDVVWDPFCGSGSELEECARLEPSVVLHGFDRDPDAVAAARQNLEAAGLAAHLVCADSLALDPPRAPSLIITNPPMGRRVRSEVGVHDFLRRFVERAARTLASRGRLVWVTPAAKVSIAAGRRAGFEVTDHGAIDLTGLRVHLQVMRRRS